MPRKKRKPPTEMTTDEVREHLFHPDMADALKDAVSEPETEESDENDEPTTEQ